jgi:quinol monooxygenase YgiN
LIIVAGTAEFGSQSERDEAVAAAVPHVRATREDEPGCLAYVFTTDSVEPTHMVIYELWEDGATLAAHFKHANYWNMLQLLRSFEGMKAQHKKYRTDAIDAVYGEDRVASSRFWSVE